VKTIDVIVPVFRVASTSRNTGTMTSIVFTTAPPSDAAPRRAASEASRAAFRDKIGRAHV